MSRRERTTEEAARAVGITRATLQAWIKAGSVAAPEPQFRGARGVRLWSPADVASLRRVKAEIYRKGRGRKAGK